ncbi:MAG: pilus assembly protein PilM [Nitrospirae bacterium]|nr:pilus assembly protein PilM [Nitrospirota bacterium]
MFEDKLIKTVLGIEFQDDSFTVACLERNFSGISLISSSMFPFKDDDETINEIKKFTGKYLTGPFKVFISVPDKWTITKFTEIPLPKSEESVLQLARYEIERHIPFQIDDIFYDAVIADKKNSSCTAALIAVPKEKIEGIRKLFERLAINIDGLSISHFAMLSAIELSAVKAGGWREVLGLTARSDVFGGRDETGLSLVIGKKEMVLSVMKNNLCQYFKTIPYDAEKPMDIISEGLSFIIKEVLAELSLQKIHKLAVSGDSPLLQNLADALRVRLGVNTQTINPLAGFLPADRAAEMQGLAPAIGACLSGLGLASIKLNLLPHKKKVLGQARGCGQKK